MKKNTKLRGAVYALLFLAALTLGWLWLGGLADAPEAVSLPYTPQNPGGWTLTEEGGGVSLSRTLERPAEHRGEFSVLRVNLHGQSGLTAELDGERIFASPAGERDSGIVMFSLPEDYDGKTLTLRWVQTGALPLYPSAALTTPLQEQNIYYAKASGLAIPAAVSLTVALLTLGLFCLTGALGRFQPALLLLALGPLSQALYWWARMPQNAATSPWVGQMLGWTNQVFCWFPILFLIFQAKRKKPWLITWAVLAAADFGLSVLLTFGAPWLAQNVPTLAPYLTRLPILLELAGGALILLLSVVERKGSGFFKLYALPVLLAGGAVALYAVASGLDKLPRSGPGSPIYLLFGCTQLLALAVSLIRFIQVSVQRDGELRALSTRAAMAQEQLAVMKESAQAIREQGHETRHHYVVLEGLLQSGSDDRAITYLRDLLEQAEQVSGYAYTAHPAVNVVLTIMLARAKRQGIRAGAVVELPEQVAISDADLTTLLMNLLENALEANEKAPEGAEKWLKVRIYIKGLYLFIGVENARFAPVVPDEETGLYRTTKSAEGHGMGLKAVQAIARKYTSELLIELPENGFSVSTALLMEP